jgi:hypothetical protein
MAITHRVRSLKPATAAQLRVRHAGSRALRRTCAARRIAAGTTRLASSPGTYYNLRPRNDTNPASEITTNASGLVRALQGPYYSIDVECVATGTGHNARAIAQIGLVDANGRCVLNLFVKPPAGSTVVSYLTPLTGITAEMLTQCVSRLASRPISSVPSSCVWAYCGRLRQTGARRGTGRPLHTSQMRHPSAEAC